MQADIKSLCRNLTMEHSLNLHRIFWYNFSFKFKKTERWLAVKIKSFPLNQNTITDEHGRSVKALVAEQIIDNAKKNES